MSSRQLMGADYRDWLGELKQKVRQTQVKTAVQVNTALLNFYWELGAQIVERQKTAKWGSGFLKQLSLATNTTVRSGAPVDQRPILLRFPWPHG